MIFYVCFGFAERATWLEWHDGEKGTLVFSTQREGPHADHTLPWSGQIGNARRSVSINAYGRRQRTEANGFVERQDITGSCIFRCLVSPRDPCVKDLATKAPESGSAVGQQKALKGGDGLGKWALPVSWWDMWNSFQLNSFHHKTHGKGQTDVLVTTVTKYLTKASSGKRGPQLEGQLSTVVREAQHRSVRQLATRHYRQGAQEKSATSQQLLLPPFILGLHRAAPAALRADLLSSVRQPHRHSQRNISRVAPNADERWLTELEPGNRKKTLLLSVTLHCGDEKLAGTVGRYVSVSPWGSRQRRDRVAMNYGTGRTVFTDYSPRKLSEHNLWESGPNALCIDTIKTPFLEKNWKYVSKNNTSISW